jgi:hypothetical protein
MIVSSFSYSSTLKRERHVDPKRRLVFNGVHGIIFQKIELFITTAVRTSNPTRRINFDDDDGGEEEEEEEEERGGYIVF